MRRSWATISGFLAVSLGGTAAAQPPSKAPSRDFEDCDGMIRSGLSDEIFKYPLNKNGVYLRETLAFYGSAGLLACDRALADAELANSPRQRSASLLQSKALHQLASGDATGALVSLDQSETRLEGDGDRFFRQSIKARTLLIRAFALKQLRRTEEASTILDDTGDLYPWSPSYHVVVAKLRLSIDHDVARYIDTMSRIGRRSPDLLRETFWLALASERFGQAAAISPYVRFAIPLKWTNHGESTIRGDAEREERAMGDLAELRGAEAYALTALGQEAEGLRSIEAGKAAVNQAVIGLKMAAAQPKISESDRRVAARRVIYADEAGKALDGWAQAVAVLTWNRGGRVGAAPLVDKIDARHAVIEPHLAAQLAKGARTVSPTVSLADTHMERIDLAFLLANSPQPENAAILPKIRRAGDGWLRIQNGYSIARFADSDIHTVRFHKSDAPLARVEESAVLAAALYARSLGRNGFIILDRRSLHQITTNTVSTVYSYPDGYENQMNLVFIDKDRLPPEWALYQDRVVDIAPILATVAPAYRITELPK